MINPARRTRSLDHRPGADRNAPQVRWRMSVQAGRRSASAHVVVLGNEKGGSGKSTTAMHVAVALMNMGQRVATVDLDSRQKSFTHYVDNRRAWAKRARLDLKIPIHFCVAQGSPLKLEESDALEF